MAGKWAGGRKNPLKLNAADDVGIATITKIIFELGQKLFKARYDHNRTNINLLNCILLLMANGFRLAGAYALQTFGAYRTMQAAFRFLSSERL